MFDELDSHIAAYCTENKISGVVRVTVKDEIKYSGAFGFADFENQIPFTDNSMFTFYSLSKPFCALGLLKLVDRGQVDLDVHPSVYIPETSGFDANATIRQMLHHTSGLPDFHQSEGVAEKFSDGAPEKIRGQLSELSKFPSFFAAGTAARYANINFVLSALIIENVSGISYPEYMRREVFEPLGMKTACIDNKGMIIADRVQGHELLDGKAIRCEKAYDWMLGGGDIIGRVDDVYCLNKAIKNRLLVSDGIWEQILTPSPLNNMGMGCTVTYWHGKKRITHNGGHKGFRTLHIQLPEDDFDIIFLSNSGFGNARDDISEMIYNAFYGDDRLKSEKVIMDAGYI